MKKVLLIALLASTTAMAQENSSTTATGTSTLSGVSQEVKKEELKKIDEDITNNKMRAELGANKRFSFQAAINYSGSTVEKPLASVRPSITGGLMSSPLSASLGGTVSGKYKIDTNNSLSLDVGVSILDPLHGSYESDKVVNQASNKETSRFKAANPALAYTHAGKIGGLMSVSSVSLQGMTDQTTDTYGYFADISFSQTLAMDAGSWTTGIYISADKALYKTGLTEKQKQMEAMFSLGISPFAEYAFNDTFSFRTVFNYFGWDVAANGEQGEYSAYTPQQSMGLGISVTRDIYLYPNVQFQPLNMRSDLTNVALNTIINL